MGTRPCHLRWMERLRNFVHGEWVEAKDGRTADIVDPSTGQPYATAPVSEEVDVDVAMRSAATAFETWRDATPSDRQQALLKAADALERRAAEFVEAECRNTGKPVGATTTEELPPAIDNPRFSAGAARMLEARAAAKYMAAPRPSTPANRSVCAPRSR